MRPTPLGAARNRLPDKDDEFLEFAIYETTAYPFARSYKWLRQLVRYATWARQGISTCFCCGRPYLSDDGRVNIYGLCGYCTREDCGDSSWNG